MWAARRLTRQLRCQRVPRKVRVRQGGVLSLSHRRQATLAPAHKNQRTCRPWVVLWHGRASLALTCSACACSRGPRYVAGAAFNARTGRFVAAGNNVSAADHWAKAGLESDRAGRQMSAFFDPNTLEENERETKRKKRKLKKLMSGDDWRKYKAARKSKKAQAANAWLYEKEE